MKKPAEYPVQTTGSKMAAKARAGSNNMTDEEKDAAFKRGMAIIYGQGNKQAACARH